MDIDEANPVVRGRYLECGKGWYKIIADLDERLSALDPDYRVSQIKEKFGGLRYYAQTSNTEVYDEFYACIREAERLSDMTCELTGTPGVLMVRGGWYKTLNPDTAPEGFIIASIED